MLKYFLTICLLSTALQPLAVRACAPMDAGPADGGQVQMLEPDAHDCCDTEKEAPAQDCDEAMQCNSCYAGASLVSLDATAPLSVKPQRHLFSGGHRYISPDSHPLIRPPIS